MITKAELVRKLARRSGVPVEEAKLFFEIFLKRAAEMLKPGSAVFIKQYGYFQMKRGKIKNVPGFSEGESEPVYTDLMVFTNDEVKDDSGLFFNIPLNLPQESHPLDSFFSLSIGKPVIPLKNVSSGDYLMPPGGLELRRLIDSKVDKLLNEIEVIEDYSNGQEVLLIDAAKYDSNQFELSWGGSISQSAADASEKEREESNISSNKEFENIPWNFGENLSKQIEEESILDLTGGDRAAFKDTSEEQNAITNEQEEKGKLKTTPEIVEDDFQEVKSTTKDVILPSINIEEQNEKLSWNFENKTESEPQFPEVEEEKNAEGFSRIKFKTATQQFNMPDELNLVPESDEEFRLEEIDDLDSIEEEHPVRKELPEVENKLDNYDSENSDIKSFGFPEEAAIPKKKNWLFVFVIAGFLLVVAAGYFIYLNLDNILNKKPTGIKASKNKITNSIVNRTYEIPVTYPYPKGGDTLKSRNQPIVITSSDTTQAIKEELLQAEKKVEIKKTEQQVINTSTEQTKNPPEKVKEFIYKYDNVYFVQMSSWPSRTAAEQEAARYQRAGRTGIVEKAQISGRGTWYRVLAGKFNTLKEAEEFKIIQK